MKKILLTVLLCLAPFFALAENIYEIKKVDVFVQDKDPSMARQKAISQAEQNAFEQLQKNLVEKKKLRKSVKVNPASVTRAVDAIDVVNEKFSTAGYRAQLDVVFNPNEVSRVLGVGVVEPTKEIEKFLIVPIVLEQDKVRVWKHKWWDSWNNYRKDTIILPVRDLQDIKDLKDEDLAKNNLAGLQNMATRYGANNIVLVQADYKKELNSLEVQLEKIRDKQKTVVNYEYPGDESVTEKDLYDAAANDIVYRLDNNSLTEQAAPVAPPEPSLTPDSQAVPTGNEVAPATPLVNSTTPLTSSVDTPDFGNEGSLSYTDIYVNAPDLLTWNRVRNKIVNTQGVRDMQIKSFTAGRAFVVVGHSVNLEQVKSSLEAQNFEVFSDGQKLTIRER